MSFYKLGFLASGRGTNMQAIIDACKSGKLKAKPVVVISNNGKAAALDRAEKEHIPAFHIGVDTFPDNEQRDQLIADSLKKHDVDLVILAGYMKMVGPKVLASYPGKIINIHPALLPKYGGHGMYGKFIHEKILADGETETGITIHLVDDQYDTGAILAQRKVAIMPGDTAETLAARVLKVEHTFFVETVGQIIEGNIKLPD